MKNKSPQIPQVFSYAQAQAFFEKNLMFLVMAGWMILGVEAGSSKFMEIGEGALRSLNQIKSSFITSILPSNFSSKAPLEGHDQERGTQDQLSTQLSLQGSRFAREILALGKEFPLSISVGDGPPLGSEKIIIQARSMLLTDKNRPRVNQKFVQTLSPLIARARGQSRNLKMTLVRSDEISETWVQPIEKFMKRFYGLNISQIRSEDSERFEVILEISK